MDVALEKWISELEMDEYLIDQCPVQFNEFDEYVQLVNTPDDNFHKSSASTIITATAMCGGPSVGIYRAMFESPPKRTKTDKTPNDTANENIGSLLDPNKDLNGSNNDNNGPKVGQKRSTRTPIEAPDRVMAERKRREKLSERFIALSAMVPGLKKMDKASVLGDAIKYLKQLKENNKALEEKINKKPEESVVFLKKSQMCLDDDDDDNSSCDNENSDGHFKEALPEIEARLSDKTVLIRIHCAKQKGFAAKLLSEIEKLHLAVITCSFSSFGEYAVDTTVVSQMEAEFCLTVKELVKNLRTAFTKFM